MSTFFDSKAGIWTGRIVSALPVLALLMSAFTKLTATPQMLEQLGKLGYAPTILPALAALELGGLALYLVPQTAILGAILLTGYLGGATAAHVRLEQAFVAPVLLGVLLWAGVFARDARVRALLPLRRLPVNA